jgi:hypothetical protein
MSTRFRDLVRACGMALAATAAFSPGILAAAEPRAVAGHWEGVGTNGWLLRDPLTARPVALLDDPFGSFSPDGAGIIEGLYESHPIGLDVISANGVSPEFWAQPSVRKRIHQGPSAYSGFGTDAGPREWAGRPDFDRRAYDLDPGWRDEEFVSAPSPGAGTIGIQIDAGSLTLAWHAQPGRVYTIEFTTSLNEPFQPVQTLGTIGEGDTSVELPMGPTTGFYRIAEQVY